jgi:hypothetical protein
MSTFGGGGGGDSKSKPYLFPGQEEFGSAMFAPGSPLWSLLQGGPNVGMERQALRGAEGLTNNLAQQGLTGSGLAAKSLTNYQTGVAGQRQDNMYQILLQAMRPTATISTSGGGGGGTFGI